MTAPLAVEPVTASGETTGTAAAQRCRNCGTSAAGNFCPNCGQERPAHPEKLNAFDEEDLQFLERAGGLIAHCLH